MCGCAQTYRDIAKSKGFLPMSVSPYDGKCIVLTTKHAKACAAAPAFDRILGAGVIEYHFDTDTLGTFSGEIEREGTALDAARKKVQLAISNLDVPFVLASEGSFGPHPEIGFIPANHELLHFVDRERDFALTVTMMTTETNYRMAEVGSIEELHDFAETTKFPRHGLILSALPRGPKCRILKGINGWEDLDEAFHLLHSQSRNEGVWVETDMRANFNPTRMTVIGRLAEKLARQLSTPCPSCGTPGWGDIGGVEGLECGWCGEPTRQIKSLVQGCPKCDYRQTVGRPDGLQRSDPAHCPNCNP